MTPATRQELLRLLSALCEGALTDAEHARLDELLRDAACRRLYLEYLDLHARLLTHPGLAERQVIPFPAPATDAPPRRRLKFPLLFRYALVSAGTLAASLLIQALLFPPRTSDQGPAVPGETAAQSPGYVATLTEASACVWEDKGPAWQTGSRLLPGELRLRQGLARLRFDGGSDLVLEGPATLRLESMTAATVVRGRVVFQGNETAAPFELRTPASTLVDLGTEYAVAVGPEGEEVHVFDGEVRRAATGAARGARQEQLTAGQARAYGPAPEAPGRPVPLDETSFKRRVDDPAQPALDPTAGLLAYEGFDYPAVADLDAGRAAGGFGWLGPWTASFVRPLLEEDKDRHTLNPRQGLVRLGAVAPGVGGSLDYRGFTKHWRRLARPVRLDGDGVYYLSYLFRRQGPAADPVNAVAVLLWTHDDFVQKQDDARKRLNVGVGGPNLLFTHLQSVGSRTPLPLIHGETYLLVAKIVAGADNPDQVFLRVYGPDDAVEREETGGWTVAGPSFHSDLTFDWLQIHINSKTRQTLDELRLGTTWTSVTGPCAVAPGGKP